MVSKNGAVIVALLVVFSILGGTAIYFNHYSKMKSFNVLPSQNFSSNGISNLSLPSVVSLRTNGVYEVGSAWIFLNSSDMNLHEYLLAYYNSSQNAIYYISIVSQNATGNFSIPDNEPSQSIMNGAQSLPAYYDVKSTFLTPGLNITQVSPGNFRIFNNAGTTELNITYDPFNIEFGLGVPNYILVKYPVRPNLVNPFSFRMHNVSYGYYATSTAPVQQDMAYYFVTGIAAMAHTGDNTIYWNTSAAFLTNQGLFTDSYNVYHLNYKLTISIP